MLVFRSNEVFIQTSDSLLIDIMAFINVFYNKAALWFVLEYYSKNKQTKPVLMELTYSRGWHIFSVQDQTVNMFTFADYTATVTSTRLCLCTTKAASTI